MAGEDNLIPFHERTEEEQREIRRKGGIASGKARRRKSNIKKALEAVLSMTVPKEVGQLKKQLEDMGLEPTMEQALALSVTMNAIKHGDHGALRTIISATGQDVSLNDRKEQAARVKRLNAETERLNLELARKTGSDSAEHVQAQAQAISEMINSATAERTLSEFLGDSRGGRQ